ncbi:MAG: cache domain-containing protein, partial [Gammaproteobacteria bacterium]|nr:cache domain-containing protein [Gammaproteobacteria bacterium]
DEQYRQSPAHVMAAMSRLAVRVICIAPTPTAELKPAWGDRDHACGPSAATQPSVRGSLDTDTRMTTSPVEKGLDGRPIFHIQLREGTRIASAAVSTDVVTQVAAGLAFGTNGHAVVVDQTGRVLAHPRKAWRDELHDLSQSASVSGAVSGQRGYRAERSQTFQSTLVTAFSWVPGPGWGVLVREPTEDLAAGQWAEQRKRWLLAGVLWIFASALAWRLACALAGGAEPGRTGRYQRARSDTSDIGPNVASITPVATEPSARPQKPTARVA